MSDYLIPIPKSHKEHGKFRRKQLKKEAIKSAKRESKFFDGPKPKSGKLSKSNAPKS